MNTEKNEVAAITGTTESGFRYTLPPDALDDYELLENLCDIDNGDASKITVTARQLLGDAQIEALKDHVRKENGRVPASKMIEEIIQCVSIFRHSLTRTMGCVRRRNDRRRIRQRNYRKVSGN